MKQKLKLKPYYIEWEDSVLFDSGWGPLDGPCGEPPVCVTVGYIVSRSRKALTVVSSISLETNEASQRLVIPTSAVRKKRILSY